MRSSQPQRIGTLLGKSELARLLKRARALEKLDARLHELIPAPLNAHCRVLSVQNDTLILAADSPVWAARLRFQSSQIVKQLSRSGTVTWRTLRVRVRAPRDRDRAAPAPAGRHVPTIRRHAHTLRETAREVSDPGLRAALLRLAGRHAGSRRS